MKSVISAGALALLAALSACAGAFEFETIIVGGRPQGDSLGPQLAAGVDWNGRTPAAWYMNQAGQLVFLHELDNGVSDDADVGIWRWTDGAKELIAREGDQVPGAANGTRYASLGANSGRPSEGISLNANGSILFTPQLTGTPVTIADDECYVLALPSGPPSILIREGGKAPTFSNFISLAHPSGPDKPILHHQISSPHMSADGTIMMSAFIQGPGISDDNNQVLFVGQPDNLQILAREGDLAPDVAPGARFGDGLDDFYYTNGGPQTFVTDVVHTDGSREWALYRHRDGNYKAVATNRSSTGIPGLNFHFSTSFRMSQVNLAGDVSFGARFDGFNDLALYLLRGDQPVVPLAARTLSAPGTTAQFGTNANNQLGVNHVLTASGDVAFMYDLVGAEVGTHNDFGIWINDSAGTRLALREGSAVDMLDNVTIGTLRDFTFNDNQNLVVVTDLGGNVSAGNDRGMWWVHPDGHLELLLREGSLFDVDPTPAEEFRTISDIKLGGYFYYDMFSRYGAFNDADQLAFALTFTDGTSGLFVTDLTPIPEPTSIVLAVFGMLWLLKINRRRCRNK